MLKRKGFGILRGGIVNSKNMFHVYAIKSIARNYMYVGMTDNLTRRFKEHNDKKESTTRTYAPFKVIFTEEVSSRGEARKREKYFKSGVGREYLKSLVR